MREGKTQCPAAEGFGEQYSLPCSAGTVQITPPRLFSAVPLQHHPPHGPNTGVGGTRARLSRVHGPVCTHESRQPGPSQICQFWQRTVHPNDGNDWLDPTGNSSTSHWQTVEVLKGITGFIPAGFTSHNGDAFPCNFQPPPVGLPFLRYIRNVCTR